MLKEGTKRLILWRKDNSQDLHREILMIFSPRKKPKDISPNPEITDTQDLI